MTCSDMSRPFLGIYFNTWYFLKVFSYLLPGSNSAYLSIFRHHRGISPLPRLSQKNSSEWGRYPFLCAELNSFWVTLGFVLFNPLLTFYVTSDVSTCQKVDPCTCGTHCHEIQRNIQLNPLTIKYLREGPEAIAIHLQNRAQYSVIVAFRKRD